MIASSRLARKEERPDGDVGMALLVPRQDLSDAGAFALVRRRVSEREAVEGGHPAPAELRLGEGEVERRRGRGLAVEGHDNGPDTDLSPAPAAGYDDHRALGFGSDRRGHRTGQQPIDGVEVMAAEHHQARGLGRPAQHHHRRGQLDQRVHLHRGRNGQLRDDITHDPFGGVLGGRDGFSRELGIHHRDLVSAHHQQVHLPHPGGFDRPLSGVNRFRRAVNPDDDDPAGNDCSHGSSWPTVGPPHTSLPRITLSEHLLPVSPLRPAGAKRPLSWPEIVRLRPTGAKRSRQARGAFAYPSAPHGPNCQTL